MDHSDETGSTPETDTPEDDVVSYGNPPMKRRFKSGESGNPKGRPRGSKNRKTIIRKIANEMHTVTENDRRRRLPTLELMVLALRNKAATGDVPAFRAYNKFLVKYEPQESSSKRGYLVVGPTMTQEEAIAEGEKANIEADARHAAYLEEKRKRETNG
jgi:hypothetical protein